MVASSLLAGRDSSSVRIGRYTLERRSKARVVYEWEKLLPSTSLPPVREQHFAVTLDHKLIVFGGMSHVPGSGDEDDDAAIPGTAGSVRYRSYSSQLHVHRIGATSLQRLSKS